MNTLGTKLWSLARKVVYTTRYMIILFVSLNSQVPHRPVSLTIQAPPKYSPRSGVARSI